MYFEGKKKRKKESEIRQDRTGKWRKKDLKKKKTRGTYWRHSLALAALVGSRLLPSKHLVSNMCIG